MPGFEPIFNHVRFGSKADLALALRYVGFVPLTDILNRSFGDGCSFELTQTTHYISAHERKLQ